MEEFLAQVSVNEQKKAYRFFNVLVNSDGHFSQTTWNATKKKHSTLKKILFHGHTMEWNLELFLPTVCTSPLMLLIQNTTVFRASISPNTFKNEKLCSNLNALLE